MTSSWDEAFADRYGEWSAHMTADVAFYVGLALESDGPLVELAIGNGRVEALYSRPVGETAWKFVRKVRRNELDKPDDREHCTTDFATSDCSTRTPRCQCNRSDRARGDRLDK